MLQKYAGIVIVVLFSFFLVVRWARKRFETRHFRKRWNWYRFERDLGADEVRIIGPFQTSERAWGIWYMAGDPNGMEIRVKRCIPAPEGATLPDFYNWGVEE